MRKLTAKIARRIADKSKNNEPKTFQDAIDFIVSEAKNGHSNTFIDGKKVYLEFLADQLKARGFKVNLEKYLEKPFLNVEW